MRVLVCLTALALLAAPAADAQGQALIIRNEAAVAEDAAEQGPTEIQLAEAGWDVQGVASASASDLRQALAAFVAAREDVQSTLAVVLYGAFVHAHGGAYLLPADDLSGPGQALADGLPLDSVLAVLATVPGRAILVLGETDSPVDGGVYAAPGIGRLDIPQGVTVVRGRFSDVRRFVERRLPVPDENLTQAAAYFGLVVEGFAPDGHRLRFPDPTPAAATPPKPSSAFRTADDAAWRLAQEADSRDGYRTYLDGFPDGRYASAARQRLAAIDREPFYAERRAEDALALSGPQRRNIQRNLTVVGHDTKGVDGVFGPATRAAIRSWQDSTGTPVTGYLDQPQIARLATAAEQRRAELAEEVRRAAEEARLAEQAAWDRVQANGDEESLRAYLDAHPDGRHAAEVRALLARIDEDRRQDAIVQDRWAWQSAQEAGTAEAYRRYLEAWPDGRFAAQAQERLDRLDPASASTAAAARAQAAEAALNLNATARRLAELRLARLGFRPGPVDGTFTAATRDAIAAFQTDRGVPATGYIDRATVAVLLVDGRLVSD